jgi:hypothetical protein
MHRDEVQFFLGIFQQIAPALNRCIYCFVERRIQQEKLVPQFVENKNVCPIGPSLLGC